MQSQYRALHYSALRGKKNLLLGPLEKVS